jgi:hypothetical protein
MLRLFRDVVMVQGHGAWGVLQIGSVACCIGRSESGPRWTLTLFKPYSKRRFHFHYFHK